MTLSWYSSVAPYSKVIKKFDYLRNMIGCDASYLLESWNLALVLNAKRLLFRRWTHVGFQFVAHVKFPWFWRALIPCFPFRGKKKFPLPLPYLVWTLGRLRNLHSSQVPGKASFLYALMVGFEFLSQECPSFSFFFSRLGVFLEYSSGQCPQVEACLFPVSLPLGLFYFFFIL